MNNPQKLPNDVKFTILSLIRGQDRRRAKYVQDCDNILNSGGAPCVTYKTQSGMPALAYLPSSSSINISDTERKALALKALNESIDVKILKVIDETFENIGYDISSKEVRHKLQKGIYLNCISRDYPYEKLELPGISRKSFYKTKYKLLFKIAKELELY